MEHGVSPLTLIENPEAHLHPMTVASIWNVIDRIGGQKIIATHSGTLLGRARLSAMTRLTVMTARSGSGAYRRAHLPQTSCAATRIICGAGELIRVLLAAGCLWKARRSTG